MKKKKKEQYSLNTGTALSPLDGRYNQKANELSELFSEKALMRFRLLIEVEWLIFLSVVVKIIRLMTIEERNYLRSFYQNFSDEQFLKIKGIEQTTNHDVNAVVRYLQRIVEQTDGLRDLKNFVHFGLTSEDVNNTSSGLQLRGGVKILINAYIAVLQGIRKKALDNKSVPLLAHTHGQPASPTTVGWEMNVFYSRLQKVLAELCATNLELKFGGATGGHNALYAAAPDVDWRKYSKRFINFLNRVENKEHFTTFKYNPYCTQRESMDSFTKLFANIRRANTILIDFDRDMWTYISMNIFKQTPKLGEDGSSTMPNKVNPIDFENSEGNLGMANAIFNFFIDKLPVSRLQRDLSDSTVIRNFGVAFGYTLLALKNAEAGLGKTEVNIPQAELLLDQNWAVLAEAIQMILRREGVDKSYDLLKELTKGKKGITREELHKFIMEVAEINHLPQEVVIELDDLTPQNYIGNRKFD